DDVESYFYRTATGVEIDLVITSPRLSQPIAIEIKRSTAPKVSDGLKIAIGDIDAGMTFIVYPNTERYPVGDTIEVIGLREIIELLSGIV
ncbi:MAG: DUF4143 domain-containing protein, partial [Candidatus Pacebacteria bacterium]|nr:DUF4143 domain-containing protein [Candidatus Paceibacterota bacterium]